MFACEDFAWEHRQGKLLPLIMLSCPHNTAGGNAETDMEVDGEAVDASVAMELVLLQSKLKSHIEALPTPHRDLYGLISKFGKSVDKVGVVRVCVRQEL